MSETPNLALPFLAAGQAQKHVTMNEATEILDAVVHLSVFSRTLGIPPVSPTSGARYLVPPGATGVWQGQSGKIASWNGFGWRFLEPREGWLLWDQSADIHLVFDGALWIEVGSSTEIQNASAVGVNTIADNANRLAVKSDGVLFSHEDGVGHGDMRAVMNKLNSAHTVSHLYQTGYSGRAETGLIGDDQFAIKVSTDGATWKQALVINPTNGVVNFPFGAIGAGGGGTASMPVDVKSSAYTVIALDLGRMLSCSGTWTLALMAAATLGNGFSISVRNAGTGVITIDPNGSETVDGRAAIAVCPGEAFALICDGSNWITRGRSSRVLISATKITTPAATLMVSLPNGFSTFSLVARRMKTAGASPGIVNLRVSTNGGSSYLNATNDYAWTNGYWSGTASSFWASSANPSDSIPIAAAEMDTQVASMLLADLLIEPGGGTNAYIQGQSTLFRPGSVLSGQNTAAYISGTTNRLTNLQLYQRNGVNFASGCIELYGDIA